MAHIQFTINNPCPNDVESHEECNNRVKNEPSSEGNEENADEQQERTDERRAEPPRDHRRLYGARTARAMLAWGPSG